MDQSRIDQFFKEKSNSFEMIPSIGAWDQIESQITKKSVNWKILYRIAAVLVLGAGLIWIAERNKSLPMESNAIAVIDAPLPANKILLTIPETPALSILKTQPFTQGNKVITNEKPEILFKTPKYQPVIENIASQSGLLAVALPNINDFKIVPIPTVSEQKVTIQYFANATISADTASRSKLGKIWEYARNSSPAEMMADIRDAKDNLLSPGINLE